MDAYSVEIILCGSTYFKPDFRDLFHTLGMTFKDTTQHGLANAIKAGNGVLHMSTGDVSLNTWPIKHCQLDAYFIKQTRIACYMFLCPSPNDAKISHRSCQFLGIEV